MSVDVLISPRISFSHDIDLSEEDPSVPGEASSSVEFDFAFTLHNPGALIRQSSTADELFSDGKLLPVSINLAANHEITDADKIDLVQIQSPGLNKIEDQKIIKSLKEHLEDNTDSEEDEDETAPRSTEARPFWQFRRSSSLNVSHYGRNRGKQSIPSKLKFLSRSKSTGGKTLEEEEEEETKPGLPTLMEDDNNTQNRGGLIGSLKVILLRSNSIGEVFAKTTTEDTKQFTIRRSSSLNCDGRSYPRRGLIMGRSNSTGSVYNPKRIGIHTEKKELLKEKGLKKGSEGRRSFKDYYENFYSGEKVNPVLNLPSPYISRASVDLLGFASLFCNGRYRKKSK